MLPDCMMPDGAEPCAGFRYLQSVIDAFLEDQNAAMTWARAYEKEHGPFKTLPPDFMIPF